VAKTTSSFNSDRTVQQYAHGLLPESPFVQSSTDRWAVQAKTAVSGAVEAKPEIEIWRQPKNQLFDPGFQFAPSDSFWLTVLLVEPLVHYVVCLSVVCNVLYCGKTVRPSEKLSEGVNRKPGSKS